MEYHLSFKDAKSDKFWSILIEGCDHTVTYGKTGTAGVSKTKTFPSEEACLKDAEKVKGQKIKKGYSEAGELVAESAVTATKAATTTPAKKAVKAVAKPAPAKEPEVKIAAPSSITNPLELIAAIETHIALNELMAAKDYCQALFAIGIPENLEEKSYFLKGQIAYLQHDYATAELDLRKGGQEANLLLAEMYTSLKQHEHAYYYHEQVGTFEAFWQAGELGKTHDFETAKKYFLAATAIAESEGRPELWDCYLKLGAIHHTTDRATTEQYYNKSLATGNAEERLYNNLAVFHIEDKKYDKALEILNTAIELFPTLPLAYLNKSCLYAQTGKLDQAIEMLTKALYNGYNEYGKLRADTDLDVLREREDYKKLFSLYNNYSSDITDKEFIANPQCYDEATVYSYSRLKDNLLPDYLYKAHNVTTLEVDELAIRKFPTEILQLKKLKEWSFIDTSIKVIPEEMLDRPFEKVELELKRITEFPAYLERLQGLKLLHLSSVKFTEIPKEIGHLKQVENFRLKHSKVTRIDREIASLTNLKHLEVYDTDVTSLPVEIAQLQHLRSLRITNNPKLKHFPEELFLAPKLSSITFHKNGFPSNEASKLFEEATDKKIERKTLAVYMATLQLNNTYLAKNATTKEIVQALNYPIPLLRNNALTWLGEQTLEQPLTEDSEVLLIGKYDQATAAVKALLVDRGITIAKKYTASVTHVLVGQKPGAKLDDLLDQPVQWITESQLSQTDSAQQAPAEELSPERVEQLKTLLRSTEPNNLAMAIEVLEEGHSLQPYEPELFLAYQYQSLAPLKKRLLTLIKTSSNKTFVTLVLKKYGFKTASSSKITEYITSIGEEMGYNQTDFAYAIYKLSAGESAVSYLIENGPYDICHQILSTFVKGDELKLAYDCHFTMLPEAIQEFQHIKTLTVNTNILTDLSNIGTYLSQLEVINVSGTSIKSLPDDFHLLTSLRELNLGSCRFTKFPDVLLKLPQLEKLSLSSNKSLRKLPAGIGQLTALRELKLQSTKIDMLPQEMEQLTQLEYLAIAGAGSKEEYTFSEVLTQLPALKELHLNKVQVKEFGDNINRITSISVLKVTRGYNDEAIIEAIEKQFPHLTIQPFSHW